MTRPTLLTGEEKRRVSVFSILLTIVIIIICLLFLFEIWFLRRYTPVRVDGSSMMMTLENDDWLYADSEATPARGDIVIIDVKNATDEDGKPLFRNGISFIIKRVIALGGDEIYIERNLVYLKQAGETKFTLLNEPYAYYDPMGSPLYFFSEEEPYRVEAGKMFVMGDNRLHSEDSTEVLALDIWDVTGVVPDWAVEHKGAITKWETFRDGFRS